MTVKDLLGRMGSDEFAEWMALAQLEADEAAEKATRENMSSQATTGMKKRRRRR